MLYCCSIQSAEEQSLNSRELLRTRARHGAVEVVSARMLSRASREFSAGRDGQGVLRHGVRHGGRGMDGGGFMFVGPSVMGGRGERSDGLAISFTVVQLVECPDA